MRNMKIFSVVLCLCLLLTACQSDVAVDTSTANSESEITSEPVALLPPIESQEEITASSKPEQAVKPNEITASKKVEVSGELLDEKYSQSISDLQDILNGHRYNISLSIYSVDGSKGLEYNTETGIFGACTVKAAYTLYACKQMEAGNGSLQTELAYEQKHYESGTGDMQYSPFGTVFTMETALHKSMSISDNVGYLMSVDYFGRDGYNTYVNNLGCPSLMIKPTVWSLRTKANDLVKIWCEIYNYFGTDTEHAKFLKDSCTNTAGNYATAALSGVEYSHKQGHNSTGDWLSLSDAGIVWKGDNPYIIALLTDAPGPNSYSSGEFAKIAQIVHNDLF